MGRVRAALTWLAAAACLFWVLHDVDLAAFARGLSRVQWGWVAAGVLFDVSGYVAQGWRWRLLLNGISTLQATQAVYAGLFTNEVLPLRLGEAVRGWLARRWTGLSLKTIVRSIATERLFDGVWVLGSLSVASRWAALPPALSATGRWVALPATLGAVLLLAWRPRPHVACAFAVSGVVLLAQALAFACVAEACAIPLPIWKAAMALIVVRAGTAIPNAPANVGAYQFFTVLGLTCLGVPRPVASVFSVVVFVLLTLPLWLLGFLALRSAGCSLRQIRSETTRSFAS